VDKIIQFLKKIGVVQSGSTTWSGDASNRPADFGSDNVVSQPEIVDSVESDPTVDSTPESDSSDNSLSNDD